MNYIEKLLQGKKVEWKRLGNVCKIETGKLNANQEKIDGQYLFFTCDEFPKKIDIYTHDTEAILISGNGSKLGHVTHYKGKFNAYQRTYILSRFSDEIDIRYLFFVLLKGFREHANQNKKPGSVPYIVLENVSGFQIPIPPLEIQEKIVAILDKFTELTAELTAELTTELTARKKQYSYYRENLFAFKNDSRRLNNFQLKTLGEVGAFIRGGGLQKKDFTATGVGCIHYGQIYTHYGTYATKTKSFVSEEFAKKARIAKPGDLVIATTSENDEDLCKAVAWIGDEDIAVSSDACFYRHNMEPKYVAYFFQTEYFKKQKSPFITGAKVRRVNANDLAKFKIPVPTLKEQARIVAILDKFDTLTTSISEGLPKEIELRQKQYEYYRDLLLTFPSTPADPEPTKKSTKKTTAKK